MTETRTPVLTQTLDVAGAVVTYDVRLNDTSAKAPLLLIASPMGAGGFATLAGHFTDRTVVTYDPRGVERSRKDDDATESTPDQHADDIHRVIEAVGQGPVDLFASSGGAINALALVARHPQQVRTLVAHEPPLITVLPDREAARGAVRDIGDTYRRHGFGTAMAKFIAIVSHKGEVPADWTSRPAPDPAMFGLPTEDDGSRNDPLLAQNILTSTQYDPDFEALRAASTRIVLVAGVESEGALAYRGALGVAERLDLELVVFPSNHGGFLGGEYGQHGDPDAFAAALRRVLDEG